MSGLTQTRSPCDENRRSTGLAGQWVTILAIGAALQGIGLAGQNLSPVLVDALQQGRGLSVGMAGMVQSLELVTTAFAAYRLAPWARKVPSHRLAIAGAIAAAICHFLSSITHLLAVLVMLRFVAGIGSAMCICAANVVLSAQREPDRAYAMSYSASSIAGIFLFPALVYVGTRSNGWGVYAGEGAWVVLLLPLVFLLPDVVSGASATDGIHASRLPTRMLLPAVPIFVFTVFSIGLWAFAGTVAATAKVTPTLFGYTLSLGTAASVISSWGASIVGTRFGRVGPLVVGLLATMVASVCFFAATNPGTFVASFVVVQAVYCFALPFMFGFCSALDRTGQLATAASSAMLVGSAVAPAVVGWLIQVAGFSYLILALVVGYAVAALTMYLATVLLAEEGARA